MYDNMFENDKGSLHLMTFLRWHVCTFQDAKLIMKSFLSILGDVTHSGTKINAGRIYKIPPEQKTAATASIMHFMLTCCCFGNYTLLISDFSVVYCTKGTSIFYEVEGC